MVEKLHDLRRAPIPLFALLLALTWGCGDEERPAHSSFRGLEQTEADTTEALGSATEAGVERSPEELRREFEALFADLRRMQADLERWEARLEMSSRRIRARELELSELEKRVRNLQRTAYGLLAIGLITLVIGVVALVVSRRRSMTTASKPTAETRRRTPAPKSASAEPGSTETKKNA